MIGEELRINFIKDRAYLTPNNPLRFEQLGISKIFKVNIIPAHWIVKVLKLNKELNELHLEFLFYEEGNSTFSAIQTNSFDELKSVEKITFRNLSTDIILKTLATAKHSPEYKKVTQSEEELFKVPNFDYDNYIPYKREPVLVNINETFFVPLKNVHFKLGGVYFERKFKEYYKPIVLNISNFDIREEFEAVKNYFSNVLKTKKIQVTVNIEIKDNVISTAIAKSPEIDKINIQLIENVKFAFVKAIIKNKRAFEIEKNIFTEDEYLETFSEDEINSKIFYKDGSGLLNDILKISSTKHFNHLQFLSDKHAHNKMKLRIVHKPFSFIFLIEGAKNYHVIWETLNTKEATYVWHIEKNLPVLKETLSKIEDKISLIKIHGKIEFINQEEEPFKRIYHDYSDLVTGFVKWKDELESVLN